MTLTNRAGVLLRISGVAAVVSMAIVGLALGGDASAAIRKPTSIPGQQLGSALRALAKERQFQVLFRSDLVRNLRTAGAVGELSTEEALVKLLSGTALTYQYLDEKTVMIVPALPAARELTWKESGSGDAHRVPSTSFWDRFRLAQASENSASSGGGGDAGVNEEDPSHEGSELGEIVVTGSRIKRVERDGALPVNVYTREDIDRSGQPSLGAFLNTLNEVSVGSQEGFAANRFGSPGTVQLRGLPLGTTLVLINGRRIQPGGLSPDSDFFNLDLIPFAAIERIEIVPVGSSAVYGGDALAGVVNVILKKSLDGWAADARYGGASGTEDANLSLATGGRNQRASYLLLAAYRKQTRLSMSERDFFNDADYRRFGGPDAREAFCTPGTVSTTDGSNLPGLNAPFAGIPAVSGRMLTTADFTPTAGITNLCSPFTGGNGNTLINRGEDFAVHAAGDAQLGDKWDLFGELTYSERRYGSPETGPVLFGFEEVPASNPFNPFGVPVLVTSRLSTENGARGFLISSELMRAVAGTRGELGRDWELEATVTTSKDEGEVTSLIGNGFFDFGALAAALASTDPTTALNPFASGRAASDAILRAIWPDIPISGEGEMNLFNAFTRGPLFSLPAGPVDLIAGLEASRTSWTYAQPPVFGPATSSSRRSSSQFAELRAPLASHVSTGGGKFDLAALTLAGRRDDYDDFGDANTYQVGLEVRPTRGALLRAARATSFQPPTLVQADPIPRTLSSTGRGLTDPLNGNAPVSGVPISFGAKPDLKPQEGTADSLGALWEPATPWDVRVGVTAWQLKLRDQVLLPSSAQFFLTHEAQFPGYVTRGPGNPGPVTAMRWTYINFGRIEVSGIDLETGFAIPTSFGEWSLSASGTRTSKYDVQVTPGTAVENRLSRINTDSWAPEWKARATTSFERGAWNVGATGRYVGRYKDSDGIRDLGDVWYVDFAGNLDLNKAFGRLGGPSAVASLGVVNVANKLPQFSNSSFAFYDATQADWRGRYYTVRLSVSWQ